jgi:hydrogenase nickel incorporation protein HypA/HybF
MHEMAICESIRTTIEEQAKLQSFSRVKRVCLEIGALSGVEIGAVRFGFDVAMQGSIAEHSVLEIVACPATAWCMRCGEMVPIANRYDACPKCNSCQLQVTAGEELNIKELEVE